jgi:hypothetical protein
MEPPRQSRQGHHSVEVHTPTGQKNTSLHNHAVKALVPAMRIVGMGLRLQAIEGLPGNEELLTKVRNLDSSAEAELTAIYLFRSGSRDVEIELFPPVGKRIADFRMRKGEEEWTTVEVTEATESAEQKRLNAILMQLTTGLRSLSFPFSLEIILLREPTEEEVAELCETLPQFCENKDIQNARLHHDLGLLLLNHVPTGQLPNSVQNSVERDNAALADTRGARAALSSVV